MVSNGQLERHTRGIYLTPGDRHRPDTHALLTRAFLDDDPFAYASHHSALALHGVALFDVPWRQIHLIERRYTSRGLIGHHRHVLRPGDTVTEVDGYRTVGVPLALAQVAARFGVTSGLVSLDNALARGLCTRDDVETIVKSGRLRRGVVSARRALELADGRAESPGESRLRAIIAETKWKYDLQVNVGGPGYGYRVDMLVEGVLVVEFDGKVKYAGADGREALVAEKVREDYIRSQGYGFMRVIWQDLDDPSSIRRRLFNNLLLARAGRAA
jgi:very-short-patch-repair endonuclease